MIANDTPVVILGAGLAGLACAITLQKAGVPYLLLEKSNEVGGRLRSTQTPDGFLLDHGFQVLLTSYPELKNFLDLKSLDLQLFNSGALVYTPDKMRLLANPVLHPSHLLSETLSDFISVKDKALILKLIFNIQTNCLPVSKPGSTLEFLKSFGFSDDFIELFWRPFCAGVFLDKKLEVDSEFFTFLIKNFSTGRVAVPKKGMQEIPRQMSSNLETSRMRFGVEIKEFSANEVVAKNGEKFQARAVVCAFNPKMESVSNAEKNNFRSVINYYFSTKSALTWSKWLLLIPPKFGFHINNVSIISEVSPSYSPMAEHLISVSIIGSEDPGQAIIAAELEKIAGTALNLTFIEKFNIKQALPKINSHVEVLYENGIYYSGDYLNSPSINGALKSGRLTAEKISAQMKKD